MTSPQLKIYTDFLESDEVKAVLMTKRSPLVQCTVLKKICDHPRRMSNRACQQVGLIDPDQIMDEATGNECAANTISDVPVEVLMNESGKLRVFAHLVDVIKDEKMLIFSQSIKMLDMLEKILDEKDIRLIRMDGRDKTSERDEKVQMFQKSSHVRAFMLTTGVGSVGLNLTAATRVIVFDPDWNPGKDDQAVDRAYRIGQTKPVVVFRLITCETIEEKIYRRQIFKKSIISQNNGENQDPFRHFDNKSIRELFNPPVGGSKTSETQIQLAPISSKRQSYPALEELVGRLETFREFHAGIHDHNLVFDMEHAQEVGELLTESDKQEVARIAANIAATHGTKKNNSYQEQTEPGPSMLPKNNNRYQPHTEPGPVILPKNYQEFPNEHNKQTNINRYFGSNAIRTPPPFRQPIPSSIRIHITDSDDEEQPGSYPEWWSKMVESGRKWWSKISTGNGSPVSPFVKPDPKFELVKEEFVQPNIPIPDMEMDDISQEELCNQTDRANNMDTSNQPNTESDDDIEVVGQYQASDLANPFSPLANTKRNYNSTLFPGQSSTPAGNKPVAMLVRDPEGLNVSDNMSISDIADELNSSEKAPQTSPPGVSETLNSDESMSDDATGTDHSDALFIDEATSTFNKTGNSKKDWI